MKDIEVRPGKHRWIHYFKPPKGIVCHRFPVFSWANGCPYSCAYCYLRQTLHRQQSKMVVWTNVFAKGRRLICKDRGGAIRGNRLDIWFPSCEEALEWGRRKLSAKIIILGGGEDE